MKLNISLKVCVKLNMEQFITLDIASILKDQMIFPEYVDSNEHSIIKILNPGGMLSNEYDDIIDEHQICIPRILTSILPSPLLHIYKFDYSQEVYKFIFKYIEKTLKCIECLDVKYEAEYGRWICVYGTFPIEKQLSPQQMLVYHRKNALFRGYYYKNSKKILFETVYLTNILKIPFNCFMKAGISDRMRYDLRKEISNKAQEMFPNSGRGQTPWNEIYTFTEEDRKKLMGNREWSKTEIILRRDNNTDVVKIYFNRLTGDNVSAMFIMRTIKDALDAAPTEFIWSARSNYLQFVEGCINAENNHIANFVLNDLISRELCLYMG